MDESYSKRPIYENCTILAPDGTPIFRCARKKAEWYTSRGLASIESTDPFIARLKFEPAGPGNDGDEYLMDHKENRCVVCGSTDRLTRHHIVPYCYRRCMHHVPQYVTDYHDILPLCYTCHHVYEHKHADHLKQAVARLYHAPLNGKGLEINSPLNRAIRAAWALHVHRSSMPPARIIDLEGRVAAHLGHAPNSMEIQALTEMSENPHGPDYKSHAQLVVEQVNLQEFIIMWRKHFLRKMKPQFLPDKWDVNRPIQWDRGSKRVLFNSPASIVAANLPE